MNTSVVAMFSGRFVDSSASSGIPEQLGQHEVEEVHGDRRQVGQHDDGGGDQPPASHPADPRAEGPRGPREGGPGVGHCVVQFAVAEGHQQHGDEAHEEDRRQLHPHLGDGGPQGGGQRVGGRDAGHPDHDGADQPHRPGLQALFAQAFVRCVHDDWVTAAFVLMALPLRSSFDAEWGGGCQPTAAVRPPVQASPSLRSTAAAATMRAAVRWPIRTAPSTCW